MIKRFSVRLAVNKTLTTVSNPSRRKTFTASKLLFVFCRIWWGRTDSWDADISAVMLLSAPFDWFQKCGISFALYLCFTVFHRFTCYWWTMAVWVISWRSDGVFDWMKQLLKINKLIRWLLHNKNNCWLQKHRLVQCCSIGRSDYNQLSPQSVSCLTFLHLQLATLAIIIVCSHSAVSKVDMKLFSTCLDPSDCRTTASNTATVSRPGRLLVAKHWR